MPRSTDADVLAPVRHLLAGMLQGQAYVMHGAYVSASVGSVPAVEIAVGGDDNGRQLDGSNIFRLGCALKPLLAFGIALAAENRHLALDDPVVKYLPMFSPMKHVAKSDTTIRHLLTHTAGLVEEETAIGVLMNGGADGILEAACAVAPAWGAAPGVRVEYSAFYEWQILGRIVELVVHTGLSEWLHELALTIGMRNTWFGVPPVKASNYLRRLQPMYDYTQLGNWEPIVADPRVPSVLLRECIPGVGGFGSLTDLTRLYQYFVRNFSSASPEGRAVRSLASGGTSETGVSDQGRAVGLGVCVDLHRWSVGPLSSLSFGHASGVGACTGLCDPATGLAMVVMFNDMLPTIASLHRRRTVVAVTLAALGLRDRRRRTAVASGRGRQ